MHPVDITRKTCPWSNEIFGGWMFDFIDIGWSMGGWVSRKIYERALKRRTAILVN
jgi:hypothetical protein